MNTEKVDALLSEFQEAISGLREIDSFRLPEESSEFADRLFETYQDTINSHPDDVMAFSIMGFISRLTQLGIDPDLIRDKVEWGIEQGLRLAEEDKSYGEKQ